MTPELNSARYFALLYASAAERPALDALLGIEREIFESLRPGLDHHVAHSRLQWWREECERAAPGTAVHPLTRALIAAVGDPHAKSSPQLGELCGFVDVAIWDLASATFETRRELGGYCQRWAAAMIEPVVGAAQVGGVAALAATRASAPAAVGMSRPDVAAAPGSAATLLAAAATRRERFAETSHASSSRSGGGPGSAGPADSAGPAESPGSAGSAASADRTAAWQALGAAICEVELLAALARDAHRGRIRLPLEELQSAHVDAKALTNPPWPETVASLIRARLHSARNEIERTVVGLEGDQQHSSRGLLVWAALSWRTAKRIERALPNPLKPGRFDGISDAWFAWRIARRATIGRFRLN